MTNNLDEIIQNAYNIQNENAKHQNYKSYNRGKIKVKIGEEFYNIDVLTGINSKNKELFYDIVNIEKEPLSSRLSSENIDSGSTNNIISSLKNYVNNESKEKYSIGNNIVDNLNPTSNADIRYSKNSEGQWQNFLTENFKNNGTQETIKDVKLAPTKENIKNTNKIAPTIKEVQLKNDINNFSKQVDSVKNGTYPKNDMLTLLSQTPKPLLDIGLNDLPITMTQRHLETIMNESGKYKSVNYHNLGEEIVKQLPEAINNPLDIVQSNTDPNSIVLTTYLADKKNKTVIASIRIDGRGQINNIEIDTNVMTSAYGKNNYDKFMQDNIKSGNLLYDIDKGVIKKATMARFQLPRHSSYVDAVDNASTTNNIIPSSENYVNNEQIIS